MAIDRVIECLARVPIFAGLNLQQIAEIGRRAERCAFHDGEAITRAGEPGDGAYLILAGETGCSGRPDDRGPLAAVAPGSLVGELAMFIEHVYGATVVARGWVDCLKLERATLAHQMRDDPDIADRIAAVIRNRLNLIAAELQAIDRLLMSSIERCEQAPRACLPVPQKAGGGGRRQSGAVGPEAVRCLHGRQKKEKRPTPGEELGARSASCA
jgi:CRP-like cAMP-binding protein